MTKKGTRREFTRAIAVTGAVAATSKWISPQAYANVPGANEQIKVGMIGVGLRGGQLLDGLLTEMNADAHIAAICDIYEPHLDTAAAKLEPLGKPFQRYTDFRRLLDRSDLDAVVIATPDHWHAIQTISACRSGKDVYVEKPLSITIREGRKMVEVARETKRIVQVGTQRRSSKVWQKLAEMTQAGEIGKATLSRACRVSNMYPNGIGRSQPETAPTNFDWDMWLGPRAERPYQDNIAPYKFRWWSDYSSQMANWGVHYLDAMRWCIGEQAPTSICALGGRFAVEDDRTIPDTAQALFEYACGHLSTFGTFEATGTPLLRQGEMEIRGVKGTAYVDSNAIHVIPDRGGQFQDPEPRMEPLRLDIKDLPLDPAHLRNFLNCVKSRELPAADVEVGHRSTTMALLANISLATKSRLEWDAENEVVTNVPEANELLHYEYRSPWTLDG